MIKKIIVTDIAIKDGVISCAANIEHSDTEGVSVLRYAFDVPSAPKSLKKAGENMIHEIKEALKTKLGIAAVERAKS